MVVRFNKLRRVEASDAAFTTAWLRKAGAIKRRGVWPTRRSRRLATAQDGVSRKEIEQQELVRWRGELVATLREAELPVCAQASLASNPDTARSSALGSARASTIRKHVREFRKLRACCLATSRSVWPRHVGVLLGYLHERRLEPCARTVPTAISCAA